MTVRNRIVIACGTGAVFGLCLWIATVGRGDDAPPRTAAAGQSPHPAAPGTNPPGEPHAPTADASVEDKVRVMTASGDPEQAFKAYQLVEECLRLERDKELVETEAHLVRQGTDAGIQFVSTKVDGPTLTAIARACASLSGRTRLDHYQWLEYAVDRHTGGALSVYVAAGPRGDAAALRERPADPAVIAWRDDALRRVDDGVRAGEPDALLSATANYALLGKDLAMPDLLKLHLAADKVVGAINHDQGPFPRAILDQWAATLTPQQRTQAEREAEQIFQAWQQRQR